MTNLAFPRENDSAEQDSFQEASESASPSQDVCQDIKNPANAIKPALGVRWEGVADHKVLIDFATKQFPQFELEKIERKLLLFSSKQAKAPTEPIAVEITNQGIV